MGTCAEPNRRVFPPGSPEELDQFFRDEWDSMYGGITELSIFRDVLKRMLKRWRVHVINGELTISGLPSGAYTFVHVDHSASAVFEFCEYPRFQPVADLEIEVYAAAAGKVTDGSGFVIRVKNVSSSSPSVPPDFSLCWERRGMK